MLKRLRHRPIRLRSSPPRILKRTLGAQPSVPRTKRCADVLNQLTRWTINQRTSWRNTDPCLDRGNSNARMRSRSRHWHEAASMACAFQEESESAAADLVWAARGLIPAPNNESGLRPSPARYPAISQSSMRSPSTRPHSPVLCVTRAKRVGIEMWRARNGRVYVMVFIGC